MPAACSCSQTVAEQRPQTLIAEKTVVVEAAQQTCIELAQTLGEQEEELEQKREAGEDVTEQSAAVEELQNKLQEEDDKYEAHKAELEEMERELGSLEGGAVVPEALMGMKTAKVDKGDLMAQRDDGDLDRMRVKSKKKTSKFFQVSSKCLDFADLPGLLRHVPRMLRNFFGSVCVSAWSTRSASTRLRPCARPSPSSHRRRCASSSRR